MTQPFAIGDRVELAVGFDHLYNPLAQVGAKVYVRDTRVQDGYPHIYVEWVKEDWRYNGMPDGWTYASHFKTPDPAVAIQAPTSNDLIVQQMIAKADADRLCPDCGQDHSLDENAVYLEEALRADAALVSGDAYLIVIAKDTDGEITLESFSASLSDAATDAVETHIKLIAAEMIIEEIVGDPEEDET